MSQEDEIKKLRQENERLKRENKHLKNAIEIEEIVEKAINKKMKNACHKNTCYF